MKIFLPTFYPGPRGFPWYFSSLDFSPYERAANQQWGRKTSGYQGLESHFHANAMVRIWLSGSDWLIFLQTCKLIWLVCLIGSTEGMMGISFTALFWGKFCLSLYQGKFSVLSSYVFKICLFLTWIMFLSVPLMEFWPPYLRSIFQRLKISLNIKTFLPVINCKGVLAILPTGHRKPIIIIQLIPDGGKYLYLLGYSYPHHAIILVVCPLKSLVDSCIHELQSRDISAANLSSEDVDECNLLQKVYMPFFLLTW